MRTPIRRFLPDTVCFIIWTSALVVLPAFSYAATASAFTNFGPGMAYNTTAGNSVGNAFDGNSYAQADTFQSDATGPLSSMEIALSCEFVCPNAFTIALTQNASGQPGAVLESFVVLGSALGTLGTNNPPLTLTSVVHPLLTDGTQYWVEVRADASNSDSIAWNWNSIGDSSPEAISTNNGVTWFVPSGLTPGAYQVNATVPEPSTIGFILSGGLVLALFFRKRVASRWRDAALPALFISVIFFLAPARATAANWSLLANIAPGGAGVMILLTDGTVMIQTGSSANWMRLTPDANGSYVNGTWSALAPMNLDRLYFATQVLPSGKVWVLGGEYSGPFLDSNITPYAEIYDPVANAWSPAAPYPTQPGANHCGNRTVTSNAAETASNVLTGIYSTARMQVGWTVTGSGIPAGTTITSVDSDTQVHISNNATATQTARLTFTGQALACFGDDPTMLLPNGDILAGNIFNNSTYTYSVATDSWSFTANKFYNDRSDEEGWAKISNDRVLTYDLFQAVARGNGYAELFDPGAQVWSSISPADGTANGTLPVLSSSALGFELGPTLRLLDGRVFQIGANQHTALYTESTNTWSAGPDIIGTLTNSQGTVSANFGADDAPAAVMPNGHVILAADAGPASVVTTGNVTAGSPVITNIPSTAGLQVGWTIAGRSGTTTIIAGSILSVDSPTQVTSTVNATATNTVNVTFGGTFSRPAQLFDFDPAANSISPLAPAIPDASLNIRPSYVTRMLILPTGQLLFSDSSSQLYVYTPDGAPNPAVRPVVNSVAYNGGGAFTLTGKQLNGQNAGSTYGDDAQYDENYPIVRLTDASGHVFYCRTTNWSLTGVATGATPETVNFTLHPVVTAGNYILTVSGAGLNSFPIFVNITQAEVNGQ